MNETQIRKKTLRIVVLGCRGIPSVQGGIETHCEQLYQRLAHENFEIIIIGRRPYLSKGKFIHKGLQVIPTWSPKHPALETIIHTFIGTIYARFLGADIVHYHAIGPAIMAPFARLLRMKVITTHHGPDYDRAKWGYIAKCALKVGELFGIRFSHHIIAISPTIERIIKKKDAKAKCSIIFNGVPHQGKIPESEIKKTLDKYHISKPYVLSVGRFVPEKSFHTIITALSSKRTHDIVLAGDAHPDNEYSNKLKNLARENGVKLTGYVKDPELSHLYQGAALFVLASTHEGLPIALLEAMSHHCKVLVSDIPANKDVNLENTSYFQTENISDLRNKVQVLLESPLQGDYEYLLQGKYNWDKISQQVCALYIDLYQ